MLWISSIIRKSEVYLKKWERNFWIAYRTQKRFHNIVIIITIVSKWKSGYFFKSGENYNSLPLKYIVTLQCNSISTLVITVRRRELCFIEGTSIHKLIDIMQKFPSTYNHTDDEHSNPRWKNDKKRTRAKCLQYNAIQCSSHTIAVVAEYRNPLCMSCINQS